MTGGCRMAIEEKRDTDRRQGSGSGQATAVSGDLAF